MVEIEIPAQNILKLEKSKLMHYLSPNRAMESLGHVTKTVRLDQVQELQAVAGQSNLTGAGVGIVVLDSGIDALHSAFKAENGAPRIKFADNFAFGSEAGSSDDHYGHGTYVAAIAAGGVLSNGDASFVGVASGANLANFRILDDSGVGTTFSVLLALDNVLSLPSSLNARVVNLSLGTAAIDSYQNDPLCRAVRKLVDHGIVVVAAAGNDGRDASGGRIYGRIHSPANEPSAITVGASNTIGTNNRADDLMTSYSSRGPTRSFYTDGQNVKHYDNLIKPDLVAPGNKIIAAQSSSNSLINEYPELQVNQLSNTAHNKVMYLSGTSVSAPMVAGTAAVMLQANPNLTPNMIKAALQYTAQPLPGANMLEQGAGQLNLLGAVQLAKLMRSDVRSQYFSDLGYTVDNNGYGPAEKDQSNGNAGGSDGSDIAISRGETQLLKDSASTPGRRFAFR